jgi:hypothetical protein
MKTALVTTTINVPRVLALYRKLDPDVMFFVAGDVKTPLQAYEFCADIPNCEIYTPDRQRELGYECSELLGWNTDSRRNISVLEAMKWGAEIIVSVDDDMLPYSTDFFNYIKPAFNGGSGLQLGAPGKWFDAGQFTVPAARQRGLPASKTTQDGATLVSDIQIGAVQGIILGTPDTDAATTIARNPKVLSATDVLRNGFVVDLHAKAVFNSQLTAFRADLAPCFAQFYNCQGRNTDIFASLIMRRVMQEKNLYTYFGPPTGFHARSERDPFKDLAAEMWGLERVERFSNWLDDYVFEPSVESVVDQVRNIYTDLLLCDWWPPQATAAAMAWCNDCEKVLS